MNLAIGDDDGPGVTLRRDRLEGLGQGGEDAGAVGVWRVAGDGATNAHLSFAERGDAQFDFLQCGFSLGAAVCR